MSKNAARPGSATRIKSANPASSPNQSSKKSPTKSEPKSVEFERNGLTEHEVEIDHLKNQLIAITQRVDVQDKMRQDVDFMQQQLDDSENVRIKQEHLITSLQMENRALRAANAKLLEEKNQCYQDLLSASDYILALEQKCY